MPTLIFACRHCGQEMAVPEELRGQEVRCPHCGGVVQAPGEVAAAVPLEPSQPPSSIFDDLPDAEAAASPNTTTMFVPSEGSSSAPTKIDDPTTEFMVAEKPAAEASGAAPLIERPAPRESLLAKYLLAVLIPYAIIMTVVALWFYHQARQVVHPLEALPDWPRDNEQPARQGGTFQRIDDSQPLPRRLRVGLGHTLRVGELEFTPVKIERRPVIFRYDRGAKQDEPSQRDALVLTALARNVSKDTAFAPNDLFFNRKWSAGNPPANRPYSCLEVGDQRYYGGPCSWKPRRPGDDDPREFVAGSEYNKKLDPGQEMEYLICTDPENAGILTVVEEAREPLLWRIQVRRGTIQVRGRTMTATAVLGVEFAPTDIRH